MKPSELRKWILFGGLSVVLTLAGVAALLGPGIRYGLDRAIDALPSDAEERLGFASLDSTLAASALHSPALDAATARAADILNATQPGRPVRIYVLRDTTVNAFATPAGGIFVHTALIELFDDESELFAVLGHELGHVRHRHGLKSVARAAGFAVGLSILLGDGSALVGIGAQLSAELLQRGYGRRAEEEADAEAIKTLAALGQPRDAMLRVLTDLEAQRRDEPPEFLSTHPSPATRREKIRTLMKELGEPAKPANASRLTAGQWAAIRGATRAPYPATN